MEELLRAAWARAEWRPLVACLPPQNAGDLDKLESLTESLAAEGWREDCLPLLGVGRGAGVQLLTGAHRRAAARRANLEALPVVLLTEEELAAARGSPAWSGRYDICEDADALSEALRAAGYELAAELLLWG